MKKIIISSQLRLNWNKRNDSLSCDRNMSERMNNRWVYRRWLSIFLLFLPAFLPAKADALARAELKVADSLFAIGKYREAGVLFKRHAEGPESSNESLLLKLAFLSEKANNYTECLYYLNKLALISPSRRLFEKMDKLASDHSLIGYEFDDYNYFIIFYRRYGDYIPLALLVLGIYIVWVMLIKVRRGEPILQIHKFSILGYLLIILMVVNVPGLYQTGIIVNEHTFLREEPSSGASVVQEVGKGHKLTIVGSVDHWDRVIWDNQLVYIRKSDLLKI